MHYDLERTASIMKELRVKKKKVQEEVANETGLNIKTYQAVEQGSRGVKIDTLCILADYYNETLDYLVTGNHKSKSEWESLLASIPCEKQEQIYIIVSKMVAMLNS